MADSEVIQGGVPKRTRSGTSSPYFDLETSIKVAETIHGVGGGSCSSDQLAAWLNYKSTRSGTYLTRIAAARQFGLIQSSGDRLSVTDRGMQIVAPVMPNDSAQAKVEAFLGVELFSKIFQKFRGSSLPPEAGLKNLFRTDEFSILPDRVDQAVRVLLNSAEQAGFFEATGDRSRLIIPASAKASDSSEGRVASPVQASAPVPVLSDAPKVPANIDHPGGVHSAIVGLLRELPPPGAPWPSNKKQRFLTAFQSTIDFIYPEEDES